MLRRLLGEFWFDLINTIFEIAKVRAGLINNGLDSIQTLGQFASGVDYLFKSLFPYRLGIISTNLKFLQSRIRIVSANLKCLQPRIQNTNSRIDSIKASKYPFLERTLAVHWICVQFTHDCDYPTISVLVQDLRPEAIPEALE